jgi:predicted metal-dependent hydrolase
MLTQLQLGNLTIDVELKNIKNVHLSVYPPTGHVRVAAPLRMSTDTIRAFVLSKITWITQQQQKIQAQARETPRDYIERESHYLWGKRYLLSIVEAEKAPSVELQHSHIVLHIRPNTDTFKRQEILDNWYRVQIKQAVPSIISHWEPLMGVKVERFFVQRMKTKWGSCSPNTATIRINSELAKKPPHLLEYIVVHEMTHLLEPTHNNRFKQLMNSFMPHWQILRAQLNSLPVRHEEWERTDNTI